MSLTEIAVVLREAARISNHRHFVIAGSLSAVGAVMNAPERMVMSRDVDLYPKLDPGRGFIEIATQLGETSAFAKAHGFHADPITPQLLSLADGWEARLMQIPLDGGVVAWFLDPNDAASSKLMRGAQNDIDWVRAGLRAGIVNEATVRSRLKAMNSEDTSGALKALTKCLDDDSSELA